LDFAVALEVIPEVRDGFLCNDEFILCNYSFVKVTFMHFLLGTKFDLHLCRICGMLFFNGVIINSA
jgi:hypothetical protein